MDSLTYGCTCFLVLIWSTEEIQKIQRFNFTYLVRSVEKPNENFVWKVLKYEWS